jgi:hypothetical protein
MTKLKTGRKPIHLTSINKKPYGREAVWIKIRELKTFTRKDLIYSTNVNPGTIKTFLECLENGNFVTKKDILVDGRYHAFEYTLIKDIGLNCPRISKNGEILRPKNTTNMWRTMRVLKFFTVKDLVLNASTDDVSIAYSTADIYCKQLCQAGYLARTSGKTYRFLESRYTGPKPPMIQRIKQVFDPNIGKVVYPKEDK